MQVGDQVRLKSGGPAMTITRLHPGDASIVVCSWFDENGGLQSSRFFTAALNAVVQADQPLAPEPPEPPRTFEGPK